MDTLTNLEERNCFYCNSKEFTGIFVNEAIPTVSRSESKQFGLVRCKNCGAIYVNPAPSRNTLISYYPMDYYQDSILNNGLNKIVSKFYGKKKFQGIFTNLDLIKQNSRLVLEIGPGNGDNLQLFMQNGYTAYAIEPNKKLADKLECLGISTINSFVNDGILMDNKFDVIILSHVLEHEYDPKAILEFCNEHMKNPGFLYIEIPTIDAISFKIFGKNWGELEFPLHLSLMGKKHIQCMVTALGIDIVNVYYRSLIGDVARAFGHRFPHFYMRHKLKFLFYPAIIALQIMIIILDKAFGSGEAIVLLARKGTNL